MKVLHVYLTYFPDPPGGLQEAIRQICISTGALGVENTIFTLSPNPSPSVLERPEARVVRCRSWAAPASCDLGGPAAFSVFRTLAHEADVVHYLFPWPFADLLRMASPKKPALMTYISDIVRQRWLGACYAPLMWRTLHSMDAIVYNAPAYAQSSTVLSNSSLKNRLRLIPLGIDESNYTAHEDTDILNRLNLANDEPFLLFLGVLRYYKGLHVLLESCIHFSGKIVIAGDGPESATLKQQAKQMNLRNVVFAGQVSNAEKNTLLKRCRALVLPSHLRSEAYGMVLVEASIMGKPMVTCEIGTGTSFVNLNGETGFVVPPENPKALAMAMSLLVNDESQANKMGANARLRYESLFSGQLMGQAYLDVYTELLTRN